jgi:hypothetical protein
MYKLRHITASAHTNYEDGIDRVYRNVGTQNSGARGITEKKEYNLF